MTINQKKTVVVVSNKLETGKVANALGHLAFSAGHYLDDSWMGAKQLFDAEGISHMGISRYPFVILEADPDRIKSIVEDGRKRKDLFMTDYPDEMFHTASDEDLKKALLKRNNADMQYAAVLLSGSSEAIAELTSDLALYKN